ncbi:MAG: cyclase family protein [Ardenticatenales bacterium]|nr:cyclase family protein [Ardenticatenales bacterium]
MDRKQVIELLTNAQWYDLTQDLSIFTPPWPGEKALQVHFFKRVTGAYGGGQGANGQFIEWSNNTGTHLVGPRAFHSGAKAIADIPLDRLCGEGVVVDLSDVVSDYSIYTPEMITAKVEVKKGDILIINTGYHRHAYNLPDTYNEDAQGGIESKEFGFYVRHPGPSPEFFDWAMEMELKIVAVDCGCAEHPMNTNIRYMHGRDFAKAEAKLMAETGQSWDELYPPEAYYEQTHIRLPKSNTLLAEALGGQLNELNNQRAWIMIGALPFMEVESSWSRAMALRPPAGMSEADFFAAMKNDIQMMDLTLPFSVQTPQWANYEPLTLTYTKRVGGQYFGMGRNNAHCRASFHLASHMDGEVHFHAAGRTIGKMPFDYWFGKAAFADISAYVSNTSVYTPEMIESVVDVEEGDILIVKTGWHKYGWNSPDSDEFRYMIKHPGPSPDFADWCLKKKIKYLGVDCVAMEHPMNTIQRIFHPKTFEEANEKLLAQYEGDWDEIYPLDQYYQDMHLNLFPKGVVHIENLGGDLAGAESGRYFFVSFIPKGVELASCWGRFTAFKEK